MDENNNYISISLCLFYGVLFENIHDYFWSRCNLYYLISEAKIRQSAKTIDKLIGHAWDAGKSVLHNQSKCFVHIKFIWCKSNGNSSSQRTSKYDYLISINISSRQQIRQSSFWIQLKPYKNWKWYIIFSFKAINLRDVLADNGYCKKILGVTWTYYLINTKATVFLITNGPCKFGYSINWVAILTGHGQFSWLV